jgi:hypothetical protein
MAAFRPLTVDRLAPVFVRILALPRADRVVIREQLAARRPRRRTPSLARLFARVLDQPERKAHAFATLLDSVLDSLLAEDFFGTEGQLDPRGDHRD